uniref:Putative nucleotide-binding alpha-beta plait domain-containing protein n=1 Tax=Helianthus annuus TaxID=4232 RepID=A0A251UUX8_HELAN
MLMFSCLLCHRSEIFVGRLPKDVVEGDLSEFCEPFREVVERLARNINGWTYPFYNISVDKSRGGDDNLFHWTKFKLSCTRVLQKCTYSNQFKFTLSFDA